MLTDPRTTERTRALPARAGSPRPHDAVAAPSPSAQGSPLQAALQEGFDFEAYARSRLRDFAQR